MCYYVLDCESLSIDSNIIIAQNLHIFIKRSLNNELIQINLTNRKMNIRLQSTKMIDAGLVTSESIALRGDKNLAHTIFIQWGVPKRSIGHKVSLRSFQQKKTVVCQVVQKVPIPVA